MNHSFASDNTAGVCPEAWAALAAANAGHVPSYGDDDWTARARNLFNEIFETDCAVHFAFNGTMSNALALSAACRSYQSIFCHQHAHIEEDECGAPEFFTGGAKLIPLPGPGAKLQPTTVEAATQRGHGIHFPKPGVLSLTQSTELGTVYTPDETAALIAVARQHGMVTHMDGARFANAAASLAQTHRATPADLTWRVGVDVLSFGGTKNGMLTTEAVVIFNPALAADFDRRVKQSGQLASKQRFAAAQWIAMLTDGVWLRHAAHANAMARLLAAGFTVLPGCALAHPVEANGVFVKLSATLAQNLARDGWQFFPFGAPDTYRFMCNWHTQPADIDALLAAVRA
ncbi:MAG: low specificity L-threonine aldolase [Opitutaceae bacterium]|nr:low specificity L-threonine aldolase [Opitutaceae bacterium]